MSTREHTNYRDAVSGAFVTKEFAEQNLDTTVAETVEASDATFWCPSGEHETYGVHEDGPERLLLVCPEHKTELRFLD